MQRLFSINHPGGAAGRPLDKNTIDGVHAWLNYNGGSFDSFKVAIEPVERRPSALQLTVYSTLSASQAKEAAWFLLGWLARAGFDIEAPRPGY